MRKTKQCSFCKEEIDVKATKCPHCHEKQPTGCLKILFFIIIGFFIFGFIGVCVSKNDNRSTVSSGSVQGSNSAETVRIEWRFEQKTDDFDGKVSKYCYIEASNEIKANFGTTRPNITVRLIGKKEWDIIVKADNVVFGHLGDADKARLKFDDSEPFSVGYDEASNGVADTIFLRSQSKIIDKLKSGKKLVMELPVFMEAGQRATFNIEGYSEVCKFD